MNENATTDIAKPSARDFIDRYVISSANKNSSFDIGDYIQSQGYYCISIGGTKMLENKLLNNIKSWLDENIAFDDWNRTGRYYWFSNERDAMLFALTWS